MEELNRLERDVLALLLAGDAGLLRVLRKQLETCRVSQRSLSGVGFFTDLSVESEALPGSPSFRFGDVAATIPGLANGAGFVLLIENGVLSQLEGYTYGEQWPTTGEDYTLEYLKKDRPEVAQLVQRFR